MREACSFSFSGCGLDFDLDLLFLSLPLALSSLSSRIYILLDGALVGSGFYLLRFHLFYNIQRETHLEGGKEFLTT